MNASKGHLLPSLIRLSLSAAFLLGSVASAVAEDLLIAPPEAPQYRLKSLERDIDEFHRVVIIVEYDRIKAGEGEWANHRLEFAGKTRTSSITALHPIHLDSSGDFQFTLSGGMFRGGTRDIEVYLVMRGASGKQCLVSNAIRKGDPGATVRAREWTEEEKKQEARSKLYETPPSGLPKGHVATTIATPLIPGMPVKTGYYGEWVDAEVINFDVGGPVRLKVPQTDKLQEHPREKWIAVAPDIVARAQANPSEFKPSVQTLPGSKLIIPDGAIAVDDVIELPEGTPLLYDKGHTWKEVFVLNTKSGEGQIGFRYKGLSSTWDEIKPREKFLITKATRAQLGDPDSVKKFARNLEGERDGSSWPGNSWPGRLRGEFGSRIKSYPVKIPVPRGAQFVPEDLSIEEGTPLAACWGWKWRPMTVIRENEDGSLYVSWDDRSDVWDCSMSRKELIIQDKTVRKLRRKAAKNSDLAEILRTWTDVTGKHKVEARFVERTETKVTLRTESGREVNLRIAKLCDEDRELVSKQAVAGENPFE